MYSWFEMLAVDTDAKLFAAADRPIALVAEDDRDARALLVELLDEAGFQATGAPNGQEALGLLRNGLRPSVIVLDLMMPVMDGWDFRMNQLRDPALQNIPVVLVTAAGFSEDTIRRQLHGVEMVRKPPRAVEILRAVERAISAPRSGNG
jgi:CheY-like chemotaxis protein